MEILVVNKQSNKKSKEIKLDNGLIMVRVTEAEAVDLIRSLSTQISKRNANSERLESYDDKGTYFSIAVTTFRKTEEEYLAENQRKQFEDYMNSKGDGYVRQENKTKSGKASKRSRKD
jgi:hypothetical protein